MIRRFTTDWAWGSLGLTMATASASFASYMIATAPAEVTGWGSKGFPIFVRMDKRNADPDASHLLPGEGVATVAALEPPALLQSGPTIVASQAVDPTPTGSIPIERDITRTPRSTAPLVEFKVRNVVGDHALIEHRSRLSLVRPGSILAGAGEVLSIERQGEGWVVRTASGVIESGT